MVKHPALKRVVLSYELAELVDTVEAARILSEAISTRQFGSEHDSRVAPRALTAMLSITWARLRDLNRVIRGDLDPASIHAPHNAGIMPLQGEIVLKEWDSKKGAVR